MKLLVLVAVVAMAAASDTYDKHEVKSYDRDYGYGGYGRDDYGYGGYGRDDYGYDRDYGYGYGYGRVGYGYGYDRHDRGYGRYDRGYNRYDHDHDSYDHDSYDHDDHKHNSYDNDHDHAYAPKKDDYAPKKDDYAPKKPAKKESYGVGYHGKYTGKCGYDGLYYRDSKSFIFCSNGNSYVQPCAPGTRNSSYRKYSYGKNYTYRDFCDVNLVDDGYGVKKGYGKKDDGYGKKDDGYGKKHEGYGEHH
jgi:hypothetical protein